MLDENVVEIREEYNSEDDDDDEGIFYNSNSILKFNSEEYDPVKLPSMLKGHVSAEEEKERIDYLMKLMELEEKEQLAMDNGEGNQFQIIQIDFLILFSDIYEIGEEDEEEEDEEDDEEYEDEEEDYDLDESDEEEPKANVVKPSDIFEVSNNNSEKS